MKILDDNGLLYLWKKIKAIVCGVLPGSIIGWNEDAIPEGYEEIENSGEIRLEAAETAIAEINNLLDKTLKPRGDSGDTDFNSIIQPGVYRTGAAAQNMPSNSGWGGILVVFKPYLTDTSIVVQVFLDGSSTAAAFRIFWYSSPGWGNWKTL